jgi:hypothetical protein
MSRRPCASRKAHTSAAGTPASAAGGGGSAASEQRGEGASGWKRERLFVRRSRLHSLSTLPPGSGARLSGRLRGARRRGTRGSEAAAAPSLSVDCPLCSPRAASLPSWFGLPGAEARGSRSSAGGAAPPGSFAPLGSQLAPASAPPEGSRIRFSPVRASSTTASNAGGRTAMQGRTRARAGDARKFRTSCILPNLQKVSCKASLPRISRSFGFVINTHARSPSHQPH